MVQVNNKFEIGQEVYFLNSKHVGTKGVVEQIYAYFDKDRTDIRYGMTDYLSCIDEDECFASVDELNEHVFSELAAQEGQTPSRPLIDFK